MPANEITEEDIEAYFGAHRVIVNGSNIRGFYRREDAEKAAERYRTQSWGRSARVETRPESPAYELT